MSKKRSTSRNGRTKKTERDCTVSFTADELIRVMDCLDVVIVNCVYENEEWMPELWRARRPPAFE